ncbi:hypothetical protein [Pseudomonas sp. LRF_L74]|uniref:hypothetical protein n=1 Tax=Pseudomonas sp. LRF_L74 TaxID=3369422 RepID=UPI003F60C268
MKDRYFEDKIFSDGTPFDAVAVKTDIDYILQSTSWTRTLLLRVASASVLDAHTVAITLLEPDSGTLEALANPIVPMQSPKGQGQKQNCSPLGHQPVQSGGVRSTLDVTRLAIRTWVAPYNSGFLPVSLIPMMGSVDPGTFRGGAGSG